MFTIHWFLHAEWQDSLEVSRNALFTTEHKVCHINVLTLCPTCGDIWSRILWEDDGSENATYRWTAHINPCPLHGSGQLLDHLKGLDPETLLALYPPTLLEHELEMRNRNG